MTFDTPTAEEMPLVYDYWARSFKKSPWAGCILNKDYDQVSRNTIEEILDRGARVIVGYLEPEGGGARRVVAFSVSEPKTATLHWLCVKEKFRGFGYGRALLERTLGEFPANQDFTYTFRTNASGKFLRCTGARFTHDPVNARVKR